MVELWLDSRQFDIRIALFFFFFFGSATPRVLFCGWVHKKGALLVPTHSSHEQFASVSEARIRNAVTNLENGTLSTCPTAKEERYSWPYIGESRRGAPECAPILCLGKFQPQDTAVRGRTVKSGWRAWPQSPAEGTVVPRGSNFSVSCQVKGVDLSFSCVSWEEMPFSSRFFTHGSCFLFLLMSSFNTNRKLYSL